MKNQKALSLFTIKQAPLLDGLRVASEAGYASVGLVADQIELAIKQGLSLGKIREFLQKRGLQAAEMCAVLGWMGAAEKARPKAFARAKEIFQLAHALDCRIAVACATVEECEPEEAVADFSELCRLAAQYGVNCALEFIGKAARFHDLRSVWEIVEESDQPNGGLVIDMFHFHKGNSTLEQLEAVPVDRILLVHMTDAEDLPKYELTDAQRVYPGLGVMPLEEILGLLRAKDYQGFYSLELFNPEYWKADPKLVAEEGARALRKLGI